MERRTFVSLVGGVAGAGIEQLFAEFKVAEDIRRRVAGLPRRVLGRTKREISIVGFPGLALSRETQESSNLAVKSAFERGVNYFDVAPAYGKQGECEIKLGIALQQLDRKDIFLACKTKARDKEGSRKELERSLERLKTDHFDLYQMHHLVTREEVRKAFGADGAIETFLAARKEGKVRWFGFSAHSTQAALAALKAFPFDTVMFPISFADYYLRGFGREVLAAAAKRGAAVIAIKPTSAGAWTKDVTRSRNHWYRSVETPDEISMALRFSLSLKGVVAGVPTSFMDLFDKTVTAGVAYRTATSKDKKQLSEMARSCIALFIREDGMGDSVAENLHGPFGDHPYGFGMDDKA